MAAPSSPPKRLSLLPPELDDIDAAWGEEPPTIVPSRAPSLPARPPEININTVDEDDEDSSERVTSVPDEPQDDFARRIMAAAATEPPPALGGAALRPSTSDDSLELMLDEELSFQRETEPGSAEPLRPPSTLPTAPPPRSVTPLEIDPRRTPTVPRPGSLRAPSDAPTEGPPTYREPLSAIERARRAVTPRVRPDVASLRRDTPPGIDIRGRFSTAPPPEAEAVREMKDRFAIGDFSGALEVAEGLLKREPGHLEAKNLAVKCREVLQDMYASRIQMDRSLAVMMGPDQIRWLSLDHRAGFLLSMIDGITTAEELLDVSGMQRLDALRILCELIDQKVVGWGR